MIEDSDGKRSGIIGESTDGSYRSLRTFCTYQPPRLTLTVRHTSGADKSIAFDQDVGLAFKVDATDRERLREAAIMLATTLAAELGLGPAER